MQQFQAFNKEKDIKLEKEMMMWKVKERERKREAKGREWKVVGRKEL